MSDEDYIYPSDGSGDEVYDYGSDADVNAASSSDSDSDSNSNSNSGSSSSSTSTNSSSSSSSSEDEQDVPLDIRLENLFYVAEDKLSEGKFRDARDEFRAIVQLEVDNAELVAKHKDKWSFDALQKLCICLIHLGEFDALEGRYSRLLGVMNEPYVTSNARDKALDSILSLLGSSEACAQELVSRIYSMTLARLKQSNLPLWFKFCYRLAQLYLNSKSFGAVEKLMIELWNFTKLSDGTEDPAKAAAVFQMLALNVDFCQRAGRYNEVKALYDRTVQKDMLSTVTDIRIMGRLRENGGMMYMRWRKWAEAYNDFFQAFTSYNENGKSKDAVRCLRRMIICNILSGSEVNPFDAQEIMAYVDQSIEVEAVQRLRIAYQSDDVQHFEFTIMHPVNRISTDEFLKEYVEELRFAIQSRVLRQTMIPFTRVSLNFMAQTLSVTPQLVEEVVVKMRLRNIPDHHMAAPQSGRRAARRRGKASVYEAPTPPPTQTLFRIDALEKCIVKITPPEQKTLRQTERLRKYLSAIAELQKSMCRNIGEQGLLRGGVS